MSTTIVQKIIAGALETVDAERRAELDRIAAFVMTGVAPLDELRTQRDHFARLAAEEVADQGPYWQENAPRYAALFRYADNLIMRYLTSDEFAVSCGAVPALLHRPADATESIEATVDGLPAAREAGEDL